MATVPHRTRRQLSISSYDRVSGWLLAFLVITGVTVGGLVVLFLTRQTGGEEAIPVTPIITGGGGGEGGTGALGEGNELDQPTANEAPDLAEPELQDTLSAVASAVATNTAIITDESIELGLEPAKSGAQGDGREPGFGGGRGGGSGGGIGSGFGKGRGGPAEPQREIRFDAADLNEYAMWLDFFKIELGVLGQDNQVYYAYNLSREKPDVRSGDPADEQRLYMNPADSKFAALDRQLVVKAGISDKGPIVLQFYPAEAQNILYTLEQKHAGGRKPEQIRRTVFRVTRTGERFEFSVEEQFYR